MDNPHHANSTLNLYPEPDPANFTRKVSDENADITPFLSSESSESDFLVAKYYTHGLKMFGHTGSMTFPMTYDYEYDNGFYSSKRSGWKSFSSLEKSLSIALGLVSILALALMIAVIIVGVKLNKDDYKAPEKLTSPTPYPPWITTIPTTTIPVEVTTRVRPTTILTSTAPSTAGGGGENWCTTDQCRQILRSLDVDADPCGGNFYEFACSGWTRRFPVSENDNSEIIDQFSRMQELFQNEIKTILENDKSNGLELDAVDIAKQFYDSCLNDNETEIDGSQEIRQLIDELMLEFDNSTGDLIPLLSKIRSELDGNYIFNMWIDVHVEDNFENAIYLDHANFEVLGEILTAINETERVDLYKEFMISLWTSVFPEESNIAEEIADSLVEFEHKLLELHNTTDEFVKLEILSRTDSQITESENYTTILQFVNQTLSQVTQNECMGNNSVTCNNDSPDVNIIINDVQYYSAIDALLNETDLNVTVKYIKWRIILDFARHSSEVFRKLYDEKIRGLKMSKPRWEMCVDETIRFFGPPLISEYILATISDPIGFKEQVMDIANDLKQTALELTQQVTWIESNATRAVISQRLEQLQIFALYPLSLTDDHVMAVLDYYSDLNLTNPTSHFQNILDLNRWASNSELKLVWATSNDTMERKELDIQSSNQIVYSYLTNSLYLPTGAFLPPLYTSEDNSSIAFIHGTIGTLIGRQLIEAIENSAVSYVNGFPTGTWDEKTLANFQSTTDCMKDQYNAYNVSELNNSSINGESTVKMNTLDVGGFKVALQSWYSKGLLDKDEIPGLGYSSQQLFFIGFAQTWCASYTEEQFTQAVNNGLTTPVPYRVNAIVESFEEFSTAWNCSKHINQQNVCHLW